MGFKKGESGNPGGGTNRKMWRDAIMAAMRERTDMSMENAVKKVALSLVDAALEKDVGALKEIGDRLDGKPSQAHELKGSMVLKVEVVKFDDDQATGE